MKNVALILALCTTNVLNPRLAGGDTSLSTVSHVNISFSSSAPRSLPRIQATQSTSRQPTTGNRSDDALSVFIILIQVVCVLVIIFGILGNVLVLIIFGCRCSSLKPFETYMMNLAVADLLGTIVFPSVQLHTLLGGSFHHIGAEGCKLVYFLTTFSITESALSLILISADRYVIATRPLRENTSKARFLIVISITWVLSCILGATHMVGNRVVLSESGKSMVCRVSFATSADYRQYTIYILIIFAFQNAIPFVTMVILYSIIVCKLRNRGEEVSEREYLRNAKVMKLLIAIVVSFFVCVTPSSIFYLLYHFKALNMEPGHVYPVYVFLTMLLMMNSCINPIIYTRLHPSFGKRLCKLLSLCCLRRHRSNWRTVAEVHSTLTATVMYPSLSSSQNSVDDQFPLSEIIEQEEPSANGE